MKFMSILALVPLSAEAFSAGSLSMPTPRSSMVPRGDSPSTDSQADAITANPWRLTLDIGREPLANMPFDWARSGCRMPLVIPCDFQSDNKLIPRAETVSFTGPNGAVVSPVRGGEWEVSNNDKEIKCELTFPKKMERRDVWIDAGTTLTLFGTVYTAEELERLNQEFYAAREEAWELGGELNEIADQIEGPKKWNEEKQVWENRMDGVPSIFSQMQKRVQHMAAQAKQKQKADQRPSLKDLSDGGTLPGFSERGFFIQKQGLVKIGNVVAGRWYAEPITNL
ncbi:unnamed protein product [Cylindrotheca closterium]|uniref:Protein amnionless n=1 Tax=Cylindrotheca closterium TaxID=2856 RepID=A0AAD2CBY6_9STRA|nr:unnamed protein product [Cylindrotheca closterium]